MEILSRPLAMALRENRKALRESERRDAGLYQPDPNLSRQQRRLAERQARKERGEKVDG